MFYHNNLSGESVKALQYLEENLDQIVPFITGSGTIRPEFNDDQIVLYINNKPQLLEITDWVIENDNGQLEIYTDKKFNKNFKHWFDV